jgi:hypothetical protein
MVTQHLSNPNQNTKWKILVKDDDEDDILIVQEMLKVARGRKFDIHWQKTYAGGRRELFFDEYHAVLVDCDLRTQSGIELICEAIGRGFPAPLILFTCQCTPLVMWISFSLPVMASCCWRYSAWAACVARRNTPFKLKSSGSIPTKERSRLT